MNITKEVSTKFANEFREQFNTEVVNTPHGDITVTTVLNTNLVQAVVETIANTCFDSEGNYRPDLIDITYQIVIVSAYTDVELPDDFEDKCAFIYASDICRLVEEKINVHQLRAIKRSVDELIKYRIRTNVSAVESSLIAATGEMNAVVGQFREMYSGVSGEDIKALVGAISETKLDERKLVEAITDVKEKA